MDVLPAYKSVYHVHRAQGDQKKVLGPHDLEPQTVVDLGN